MALLIASCQSPAVRPGECTTKRECGAEEECVAGRCVSVDAPGGPCQGDDCGAVDAGHSVTADAGLACTEDEACGAPDRVCAGGVCVAGCDRPGGILCDADSECDRTTGRCRAGEALTCSTDDMCAPPESICGDASLCVAGCGAGGDACDAEQGEVCNKQTGRCVRVEGRCERDPQCRVPDEVCEGGVCIPGCAAPGGIRCEGLNLCVAGTGRCAPARRVNVARRATRWAASSVLSPSYGPEKAIDGLVTEQSKWTSDGSSRASWIALDLGQSYDIHAMRLLFAGAAGEHYEFNVVAHRLEAGASLDGPWTEVHRREDVQRPNSFEADFATPFATQFIRLVVTDPGIDDYTRIAEIELYTLVPEDN